MNLILKSEIEKYIEIKQEIGTAEEKSSISRIFSSSSEGQIDRKFASEKNNIEEEHNMIKNNILNKINNKNEEEYAVISDNTISASFLSLLDRFLFFVQPLSNLWNDWIFY